METVAHLDTHVVVWLHAGEVERLPKEVHSHLEAHDLQISPAVVLELQYLFEIRRIAEPAQSVVSALEGTLGLTVSALSFQRVVASAVEQVWTRDPFDRLIVAQAQAEGVSLVTADKLIRKHYPRALWGKKRR
jgi:PIN domain nuclease of toxin-antitoxin system